MAFRDFITLRRMPTPLKTLSKLVRRRRRTLGENLAGLGARDVRDLVIRVVNRRCRWFHFAWPKGLGPKASARCELQLLVLPGDGQFADEAACRVVVAPAGVEAPSQVVRDADLLIALPTTPRTPDDLYEAVGRALREAA